MDFDEHVAFVIAAMEQRADELGWARARPLSRGRSRQGDPSSAVRTYVPRLRTTASTSALTRRMRRTTSRSLCETTS